VDLVVKCLVCNHLAAGLIDLISKARVVCSLNSIIFRENSFSDVVEVGNLCREPRYFRTTNLDDVDHLRSYFTDCFFHVVLHKRSFKVDVEVHSPFAVDFLGWLGLDLGQADIVLCKNIEGLCQSTSLIVNCDDYAGPIEGFPHFNMVL